VLITNLRSLKSSNSGESVPLHKWCMVQVYSARSSDIIHHQSQVLFTRGGFRLCLRRCGSGFWPIFIRQQRLDAKVLQSLQKVISLLVACFSPPPPLLASFSSLVACSSFRRSDQAAHNCMDRCKTSRDRFPA
jgi:hypothetical protein